MVIAILGNGVKIGTIWVDDKLILLESATCRKVLSIPQKDKVDGLLPQGFRYEVKWRLPAAIDNDNEAICQAGMKRLEIAADPKEIVD